MRRKKILARPRTPEHIAGSRLRVLRLKRELTLRQVSEQTGISLSTIAALEQGMGKNFRPELKHTLADFYHVQARLLFPEIQEQIDLLSGKTRQMQFFIPREEIKRD